MLATDEKLIINCSRCGLELNEPGGLFFSAPKTTPAICQGLVEKDNLCSDCSYEVTIFIRRNRDSMVCNNCKHLGMYHHNGMICVTCGCEKFVR